jgi:prevent-host-death family protein
MMTMVNVRETRENLSRLLDAVAAGEEVVIMRRGQPVARLVPAGPGAVAFRSRQALREALPPMQRPAAEEARTTRDEERY